MIARQGSLRDFFARLADILSDWLASLADTVRVIGAPLFSGLRETLREIFDESAYARFLTRHQLETSPQSYAEFLRESETTRSRRPRCC